MNEQSSRSHCVFTLRISGINKVSVVHSTKVEYLLFSLIESNLKKLSLFQNYLFLCLLCKRSEVRQ